jgi:serine/threonine protein kinase
MNNNVVDSILGYGVCGPVIVKNNLAYKTIKLSEVDLLNYKNLKNYKKIRIPPPRNCDIPHKDYNITDQPFIPGINPWREIYILEKLKEYNISGVVKLVDYEINRTTNHIELYTEIAGKYNLESKLCELPESSLSDIMFKVENTVENMLSKGIIHMDLKPKNIVIDEELNPTIVDFGWSMSGDIPYDFDELEYYNKNLKNNIDIKNLKLYLKYKYLLNKK